MVLDPHTHILPGIDDGAEHVEMSLAMLAMLEQDGVSDVFLTPHFYLQRQTISDFLKRRQAAFAQLADAYQGNIRLHLGAEVAFSNIKIDYGIFQELSIDTGKHILLELPYRADLEKTILPRLEQLIYQTGLRPLIAHVERYAGIQKKPWLAGELIDMGCLLQVNADSVLQSRPGSLVDALLRKGQVQLLATDCHSSTDRKPEYRRALDCVQARYGSDRCQSLAETAQRVLTNSHIPISANGRVRKLFGKYR